MCAAGALYGAVVSLLLRLPNKEQVENYVCYIRCMSTVPQSDRKHLSLHGHIPGLDILRGVAVAGVVVFHGFTNAGYAVPATGLSALFVRLAVLGKLGVYLFFVLSGFLITSILLKQRERPRYYQNFYTRRALRILPVYLLMLAILLACGQVHWRYAAACMLFVANMSWLFGAHASEYGVFWTLAVEEQFYLLWPTFVRRLRSTRGLLVVILAGCALAPLFRFSLVWRGIGTYLLAPTNMDALFYGALCAVLIQHGTIHLGNIRRICRVLAVFGSLLLAPFVYLYCFPTDHGPIFWAMDDACGRFVPFCFFVAGVLFSVVRAQAQASALSRAAKLLSFLGYISYGLYLVHPVVFTAYDRLCAGTGLAGFRTSFLLLSLRFSIVSTLSIALAVLSRRYYEQLFLERKRRLAPYAGEKGLATETLP